MLGSKQIHPNRVDDREKIGDNLDFSAREAYNVLRSSLEFVCLPGQNKEGRVIGVTSPSPKEGKSITSINLCYSIAKKGHRVLLIDGDLRRPVISKILDIPQKPGLSNYLVDGQTQIIGQDILIEGLDVITSGETPPNPAELISSEAMKNTLDFLRKKDYDYIVIDLPPINSVSDAFAISGYLDGIIMVVRHGYTRKTDVQDACRQLEFANAKVLGFVYNGYMEGSHYYYRKGGYYKYYRRKKYGYYNKYDSYYYGYGYESQAETQSDEENK